MILKGLTLTSRNTIGALGVGWEEDEFTVKWFVLSGLEGKFCRRSAHTFCANVQKGNP